MRTARLLVLGMACCLPLAASAQWQWLDQNNKKVFSDQPPPTEVPEKNILRRPSGAKPRVRFESPAAGTPDTAAPAAAPAPALAASAAKPRGVDKDLEEKARKAEEAEKARKAAEEQRVAQAKAENCKRARQGKATFDSGMRVARLNAQGEREIMDDKARATEQQRLQATIDADCQ